MWLPYVAPILFNSAVLETLKAKIMLIRFLLNFQII